MKNHLFKILINLIIAIILEVMLFNITSYRTLLGNYEEKTFTEFEIYSEENDNIILEISNLNIEVATFKIEFKDAINKYDNIEYKIYYSDETSEDYRGLDSKQYILDNEKSKYMPLYLSGNVNGLLISIDKDLYEDGLLESITLNEKIPFHFSIVRFLITFGILMIIYLFKNSEIFNQEYSKTSVKQELVLLTIIVVFFGITTFINKYSAIDEEHDKIYSEYFVDAVYNGSVALQFEASEEFLELENPYDDLARSAVERDKDYLWDTAFYNGKFYVYFGILPLLILFLPYYAITKKYLSMGIVVLAFSLVIFVLIKEILIKIFNRYFEKIPFKIVIYSLITLCSGSLIIYANGMGRMYEMVILAGLYFVLQGIFFILKSLEKEEKKYIYIFLGSLFLALSVACRPTDLFISLLILPYIIKLLIENIKNFKTKKLPLFKLIFAVSIPYLTVGALLMWYNYIRFDNPFEFGTSYQLTIVNMSTLKSRIFSIPTGIVANLFSIPNFIPDFPFITNHNNLMEFYGYYYIENMIGGLFAIAPICFMNFLIIKANKKTENKELKIIVNLLLVVGLFIAILSIAMAGSNQRYLIDYAWMMILSGILIFIILYNKLTSDESRKICRSIFACVTIFTFLLSISIGIVSEKSRMKEYYPKTFYNLKYTICFWE